MLALAAALFVQPVDTGPPLWLIGEWCPDASAIATPRPEAAPLFPAVVTPGYYGPDRHCITWKEGAVWKAGDAPVLITYSRGRD